MAAEQWRLHFAIHVGIHKIAEVYTMRHQKALNQGTGDSHIVYASLFFLLRFHSHNAIHISAIGKGYTPKRTPGEKYQGTSLTPSRDAISLGPNFQLG